MTTTPDKRRSMVEERGVGALLPTGLPPQPLDERGQAARGDGGDGEFEQGTELLPLLPVGGVGVGGVVRPEVLLVLDGPLLQLLELGEHVGAERLGGPGDRTGRRRQHRGGRHDASNVRARLGLVHDAPSCPLFVSLFVCPCPAYVSDDLRAVECRSSSVTASAENSEARGVVITVS
ncbi:hypothetical protein ACGFWE_08190 [Streptomyces sp. NPDC048523]|uniref:hypothetical protein n=1 Tax=Streptomyces sp. NPDC048523 TaxID=3365567 RepID=UPI00371B06B7